MNPSRANQYDQHMVHYLRGLRQLFDHRLVPNHHLSLHLREILHRFGPVHSWWAFAFERFNGLIQKLNTDHQAGAL